MLNDDEKKQELISIVLEHDLELSKLKRLLREGHNTYITATSKVTQQNAYNSLTKHLLVVRDCALRLATALDRLDTSEPFLWNGCDVCSCGVRFITT